MITELIIVACVTTYIVALSGFTQSWLGLLSKWTARYSLPPVRHLRPFSCAQCMTWWCCLAWCLYRHNLTLPYVGASAMLAFFSITIENVLIFLREAALRLLSWLNDKICD